MDRAAAIRAAEQEQLTLRGKAFEEARRRRDALFALHPELKPLYEAAEGVYAEALTRGVRSPGQYESILAAAEDEYARRAIQLSEALARLGLGGDELAPRFVCAQCEDRGYVTEPQSARCACFERRLTALITPDGAQSGHSFETFDPSVFPAVKVAGDLTQRELMERARKRCELYADNYPGVKYRNLIITGNSGLGKTFLLDCIVARARARGVNAVSISSFQMQRAMRDYHMGKDTAALDAVIAAPLLAIDDLGAEPIMENITLLYLTNLLNERANDNRGIVITTNLTLNEVNKRYSERVFSRLFDARHSAVLTLNGADVRLGITT